MEADRCATEESTLPIEEGCYKPDLELLDRYAAFTAELLRLAVAGIGAIGFMVATLAHDGTLSPILASNWFFWPAAVSLCLLAGSAAFALGHRYLASDGMHYHMRAARRRRWCETAPDDLVRAETIAEIADDQRARNRRFERSGICLTAAAALLALGIFAAGLGLVGLLQESGSRAIAAPADTPAASSFT